MTMNRNIKALICDCIAILAWLCLLLGCASESREATTKSAPDAAFFAGLVSTDEIEEVELYYYNADAAPPDVRTIVVRSDGTVTCADGLDSPRITSGTISARERQRLWLYLASTELFEGGRTVVLATGFHAGDAEVTVRLKNGEAAKVEHHAFFSILEPSSFWVTVRLIEAIGLKACTN